MDDWEALRADVEHDSERPAVVALRGGVEVEVQPIRLWPDWALQALQVADHTTWAMGALDGANRIAWAQAKPTVRECREFITAWEDTTGQPLASVFAMRQALAEHSKSIEADLRRYYSGLDLRDLLRPGGGRSGLTWRLLQVLVDELPAESATKTAYRDGMTDAELADLAGETTGNGPWAATDYRIADLIDAVNRNTAAVIASGGVKPNPVQPYRRPGVAAKGTGRRATSKGVAYLRGLEQRQGGAA